MKNTILKQIDFKTFSGVVVYKLSVDIVFVGCEFSPFIH